MLTDQQLLSFMSDLESDRVERTTSTTKTDKFAEAVCAFANDFPNHRQSGYLLIGVRDDGPLAGLEVTDQLLKNLGALRSHGNIQPVPAITVSKHSLSGGDVAVVEVLPSDLPPVRYKGRTNIRTGPRKGIANEQEERILSERRVALAKTFDAHPCVGSTLNDLAIDLFQVGYRNTALAPRSSKRIVATLPTNFRRCVSTILARIAPRMPASCCSGKIRCIGCPGLIFSSCVLRAPI